MHMCAQEGLCGWFSVCGLVCVCACVCVRVCICEREMSTSEKGGGCTMMKWRVKVGAGVIMIHFNFYKEKGCLVWVSHGVFSFSTCSARLLCCLWEFYFFSF